MARQSPAMSARARQDMVLRAANVDPEGLDPEMRATLAPEAARREGAAGVQLQVRNPVRELMAGVKRLISRGKKPK